MRKFFADVLTAMTKRGTEIWRRVVKLVPSEGFRDARSIGTQRFEKPNTIAKIKRWSEGTADLLKDLVAHKAFLLSAATAAGSLGRCSRPATRNAGPPLAALRQARKNLRSRRRARDFFKVDHADAPARLRGVGRLPRGLSSRWPRIAPSRPEERVT